MEDQIWRRRLAPEVDQQDGVCAEHGPVGEAEGDHGDGDGALGPAQAARVVPGTPGRHRGALLPSADQLSHHLHLGGAGREVPRAAVRQRVSAVLAWSPPTPTYV